MPVGAGDGVGAGVGVGVGGVGVGVVPGGGVGVGVGGVVGQPQVSVAGLQPVLPVPNCICHACIPSQLSKLPSIRLLAVTPLADPITVFTLFEKANAAPLMLMLLRAYC